MKKTLAILLAVVMAVTLFTACGDKPAPTPDTKTGSVYYLNFKPEADKAWQDLAKLYTEKTGVPVTVLTAASGTYDQVLTAEMDKDAAPTMFQVGNVGAVRTWGEYCYDLTNTDIMKEMTTDAFNLKNEAGETVSIGYCYEAFGIIVNKALLKQAGYELTDITNFESLKKVADDIHSRAAELGFDAFTSAGLDGSSSWRFSGHLANMPLFYEFRDNGVTSQPATITGSWEYANLTSKFNMNPDDLAMIPIYCGVEGEEKAGLCCGTENCWAVNKYASEEDIKATLEFMKWVVTSEEGTTMMAKEFGPIPFKSAKTPENVFFAQANDYTANGNYVVTWAFNYTPAVDDWRAAVVDALTQYTSGNADWSVVKTAFVDGWAAQYAKENS